MSENKKCDYTVNCVEGGIRNLNALINVICEIRFGRTAVPLLKAAKRIAWASEFVAGCGLWTID